MVRVFFWREEDRQSPAEAEMEAKYREVSVKRKMSSLTLPHLKLPSSVPRPRFWKKRSVTISDLDPQFRVTYLGNVLTGWAKGDGCVDKSLATLWRNHTSSDKPNILMKVTICASGLKAVTKEHGLTEYWANRITYCKADPNYPKVFCWIYRHEGRKMKQELRCHAVLCQSENKARMMAERLQERLVQALIDFKKEKISRQNARLSLANTIYDNPSMPYRKILLHTGSSNYRPPTDKSKSAPKLKVIEEVIVEEDEEDEIEDEEEDVIVETASSSASNTITIPSASEPATTATSLASSVAGCDVAHLVDVDPGSTTTNSAIANGLVVSEPMANGQICSPEDISLRFITRFDGELDEEDDSDDDDRDEITNYLTPDVEAASTAAAVASHSVDAAPPPPPPALHSLATEDVDSAASVSPDSNHFSTRSSSERKSSTSSSIYQEKTEDVDSIGGGEDEEVDGHAINEALGALKLAEQDTISDESGYSEESNPSTVCAAAAAPVRVKTSSSSSSTRVSAGADLASATNTVVIHEFVERTSSSSSTLSGVRRDQHSGATTIVTLNHDTDDDLVDDEPCDNHTYHPSRFEVSLLNGDVADNAPQPPQPPAYSPNPPSSCDLTVHSAMIGDFSTPERLRYLARTAKDQSGTAAKSVTPLVANGDFMQNRITEFCINI